ncbi:serine acetyltransferase 1, chloroplastic-like [Nymphaea colorata]|uniref:serine acetyltransferase 1, chloroplastic-like n=1 Tax=Nymphaea colorata TaxID=210225 RepID=UPI00129DE6EB|nr:serine acetyltransferase 1, chloroplastic-like [Nymphaea colorata]
MATCIDSSRSVMAGLNVDPMPMYADPTIYDFVGYSRSFSHANNEERDELWVKMREEARKDVEQEPVLASYYIAAILAHDSLESALATHLGYRLATTSLPGSSLAAVFMTVLLEDRAIGAKVRADLKAIKERDPACASYVQVMLNFKGFLAIQSHRVAHRLWTMGRVPLALVIQNRVSEVFAVDIHPGAQVGKGVLLDHATGTVIGETAVIGDDVSILHNVTLGGTGKANGDRHPKLGNGVLVGAGTHVLGNIKIGAGAKIGAGSIVLKEVPESSTAVGNPARLLCGRDKPIKLTSMPGFTMDRTSFLTQWSDYVI